MIRDGPISNAPKQKHTSNESRTRCLDRCLFDTPRPSCWLAVLGVEACVWNLGIWTNGRRATGLWLLLCQRGHSQICTCHPASPANAPCAYIYIYPTLHYTTYAQRPSRSGTPLGTAVLHGIFPEDATYRAHSVLAVIPDVIGPFWPWSLWWSVWCLDMSAERQRLGPLGWGMAMTTTTTSSRSARGRKGKPKGALYSATSMDWTMVETDGQLSFVVKSIPRYTLKKAPVLAEWPLYRFLSTASQNTERVYIRGETEAHQRRIMSNKTVAHGQCTREKSPLYLHTSLYIPCHTTPTT